MRERLLSYNSIVILLLSQRSLLPMRDAILHSNKAANLLLLYLHQSFVVRTGIIIPNGLNLIYLRIQQFIIFVSFSVALVHRHKVLANSLRERFRFHLLSIVHVWNILGVA